MKISTRLGGLSLVLLSQSLLADIEGDSAPVRLTPIVVTATRTAQSLDQTLASVTVITREQLQQRQVSTVTEALNGVVGLQFRTNGGVGKATSLSMRGTESGHLLVLIDGVKIGSATLGTSAFQHIPVEQIERIEVVRGPRASLYGSEAIGGVIQIFTRDGRGGEHRSVALSKGSHDFTNASASYSDRVGNTWFSVSGEYQDSNGINVCDGGCFTVEPDHDGYDRKSGSLRIGHQFSSSLKAEFHATQASGDTESDGTNSNATEYLQQVVGGKVGWNVTEDWLLTFQLGTSRDETENELNGVFTDYIDTKRLTRSIQSDYQINDKQSVTFGYDFQDDLVNSSIAYAERSRRDEGVFAMYQLQLANWSFDLSGRRDSNEQFGSHNTGNIALGYFFDDGINITLSHGTAFKAPTFNELYFPAIFVGFPAFGNPDLKPAESRSTELGIAGTAKRFDWSASFYRTVIDDLIAFDFATFQAGNVATARIQGVEFELQTALAGWDLQAQLTLLDPKNAGAGANHNNELARRSRRVLRLDADQRQQKWRYGATLFARSNSYNDLANSDELGGYVTVDLRSSYQFNQQWLLEGKVNNLFDKHYRTVSGFNEDRLNMMLTLRWQQGG